MVNILLSLKLGMTMGKKYDISENRIFVGTRWVWLSISEVLLWEIHDQLF